MARQHSFLWCLVAAVAVGLAVPGASPAADTPAFKIIVHPDNPVRSVDASFLRNAFLKKTTEWSSGKVIRPLDLGGHAGVRDRFVRTVLKKTPSQLRNYWNQRIFSGKGVPPPVVDSTAAVIAFVLANAGAVGYLPADAHPGDAKVVDLRP